MAWLWWIGAATLLLMGVSCGVSLGARVAKGEARAWDPSVLGWAVGFHGAAGVAALMMMVQARG